MYAEAALSHPACIGIHYFTLYDESVMGRFDGENWNTGFLDIFHRLYTELVEAARHTHECMYDIVAHKLKPYNGDLTCLPNTVI